MKTHELKTDPIVFQDMWIGSKTFDIRFNDRDFSVGDRTIQKETKYSSKEMENGEPLEYTGREIIVDINYILHGPAYGLGDGWVIMSIKLLNLSEDFI